MRECSIVWVSDWVSVSEWLSVSESVWVTVSEWLSVSECVSKCEWVTECEWECVSDWVSDCVSEWVCDWVSECVSELMSQSVCENCKAPISFDRRVILASYFAQLYVLLICLSLLYIGGFDLLFRLQVAMLNFRVWLLILQLFNIFLSKCTSWCTLNVGLGWNDWPWPTFQAHISRILVLGSYLIKY